MDNAAFWMAMVALLGAVGAAATAIGTSLSSYFNTKPKLEALEYKVKVLEADSAKKDRQLLECEEKHSKMQEMLLDALRGRHRSDDPPSF